MAQVEVLAPHPGWKLDHIFGSQKCTICLESIDEHAQDVCIFDCPCTLLLHPVCAIRFFWKGRPIPDKCPQCRSKAALLLIKRGDGINLDNPDAPRLPPSLDLIELECEFSIDAPNVEHTDSEEEEANGIAAAAAPPLPARPRAPPVSSPDISSSDEDYVLDPDAHGYDIVSTTEEEDTSSVPSSSSEEEAVSTDSSAAEEHSSEDSDGSEGSTPAPPTRKRLRQSSN
jgi:hypothetical protein